MNLSSSQVSYFMKITMQISCVVIFILHLASCLSQNNRTFTQLNFSYKTNDNFAFEQQNLSKFKLHQDSLLSALNSFEKKIYLFNLSTQEPIDTFDFNIRNYGYIFDYLWINRDSMLLQFNTSYLGDQHDSALVIMNKKKEIVTIFSFNNTGAPNASFRNYRNQHWWYVFHGRFPLNYNRRNSSVISVLAPFLYFNCDSLHLYNSSFAYQIFSNGNNPISQNLFLPSCDDNSYKGKYQAIPYGCMINETFIYGLDYSNKLIYKGKEFTPKLALYQHKMNYDNLSFYKIIYDKFRNCFWWTIELNLTPTEDYKSLKNLYFQKEYNYIVQLDTNLNVISEGFLAAELSSHFIPTEKGLLALNTKLSKETGKTVFSIVNPSTETVSEIALKMQLDEYKKVLTTNLNGFMKTIIKASDTSSYLLISLDAMPKNYGNLILDLLNEKESLYDVHIFTDQKEKLNFNTSKKVQIHPYNSLELYVNRFVWPTILKKTGNDLWQIEEYPTNRAQELIHILKQ